MILAPILAILIGASLGLLGGGGSILTVPVLVYIIGVEIKQSIALSLAIVGTTALVGSTSHMRAGNINIKVALIFGPFAMVGTFLGTKISVFLTGPMQLTLFAIVMLAASYFMFKGRANLKANKDIVSLNYSMIIIQALFVGVLTGLVGVGGGFMIVPALVLIANIPMKEAVGTSLLIIAMNSFIGFIGYLNKVAIDWPFLGQFTFFTTVGILIGSRLVQYISQEKLKKTFAIFLVIMSLFIIYQNLIKN